MSSLFKSGIVGNINSEVKPFVFDGNSIILDLQNKGKIIRPLEETMQADEDVEEMLKHSSAPLNQEILDDAMDKAKEVYEDARNRATKIVDDAYVEADVIRENARQEGYDKGLEEGNMEAMRRADEYLAKLQREQDEVLSQNEKRIAEAIKESEDKVLDMACFIIEKMTGILVENYKSVMLHMINNAINDAVTGSEYVIKVSDENYAYIMDNYDRIVGSANPSISIEIFADSKLDKQNCIIESETGIVDLSMDVQVRNLITAIKMLTD
ncbi:MAG: FliH/SctL family protein [Lachnospiraceae bacterium]|nr:FliH/SctL family protein [Lachnospiraceae bacterium]